MPFATVDDPKVSRVFELGRNFSGHFAQSAADWIEDGVTHYVVVPDDLLLNPELDESNLIDRLGVLPGEAYTKNLVSADALRHQWPWAAESAATFVQSSKVIDIAGLLPDAADARAKFERMGIAFSGVGQYRGGPTVKQRVASARRAKRSTLQALSLRGRPAPYPLLAGYADFLVIPAEAIDDFVRYCGAFAAMNIFAEVAVPTALALAAEAVRTELPRNVHFLDPDRQPSDPDALRGVELWSAAERRDCPVLHCDSPDAALAAFDPKWLYVHPVKLSRFA